MMKLLFALLIMAGLASCSNDSTTTTTSDSSTTTTNPTGVENVNGNVPDTTNSIQLSTSGDTTKTKDSTRR
ncbi:MAG TPA: hypothetical protein VHK91_16660 [Flavisolibacter sp.]|jgi:ABC-type glycerol-3-phosphate transport system substrate-binding protein|nr:hypothetical protein [Flavisolibacter sp.]